MADYTTTKPGLGAVYPNGGGDSNWGRSEPLISPEQLISRHLFGIPLVSASKDPITGRAAIITPAMLQDYIDQAVSTVETETGLWIMPLQINEKLAFDYFDYASFGYFRLRYRPVASIEALNVNLSNNEVVYEVPLDWVETSQLVTGQLNVIPLTVAITTKGGATAVTSPGAAMLISLFSNRSWIPQFWQVTYTTGFPNGKLPKFVNDLIGTVAAIGVLSQLAATYGKSTSASLNLDGAGQSVSTPGGQIFVQRIKELELKRNLLTRKFKIMCGGAIFTGQV